MKKRNIQFLILFLFSLFTGSILAQQNVTGVVSDDLGEVLPGVTVLEKGTNNGTVTDFDGNFVIKVSGSESILVFSFIGMETKERNVGIQSNLSVVLVASAESLDEVVVTALGISREKRSLGYAISEVEGDELRVVPQENALNALNGRVTGVQINNTGGAGSTVKVIIRGASSLTTDNQPLYVIDGVPIVSKLNNIGNTGSGVNVDYGSAISDLNPDDIENITVLKGPSAAALYGSRAGNGVILITTRSGSNSKGLGVSFSSNSVFESPYKFLDFGTRFANGYRPDPSITQIDETSAGGVGPALNSGLTAIQWPYTAEELSSGIPVQKPLTSQGENNAENFFETATTFINSISIYNSTDKLDYRLGYSNMQHEGFIPNSDLHKNNVSLNSSYKITDKIKVSSVINYVSSGAKNRPSTTDRNANPLQAIYDINAHIDVRDMKDYWLIKGQTQNAPYNWGDDSSEFEYNNPYFLANEINNGFERKRFFGNVKADWNIMDDLSLMVRYTLNDYNEIRETKISSGYDRERNGAYGITNIDGIETNVDFLLAYNGKTNSDIWSYNVSVGGNIMKRNNSSNFGQTKNGGSGLILPNVFTLTNIAQDNILYGSSSSKKQVNSLYALASFGFKDMVYVDLTARNDWSSTLPESNNSFFYPSVSTSLLVNKMFDMGTNVSLLKVRAGWAQVGNDTDPYQLENVLANNGDWGSASQLSISSSLKNFNLKPELQTSIEFGADVSLFQNRLNAEFTYYTSDNENQILSVNDPVSSGFTTRLVNAGLVRSTGFEAAIGGVIMEKSDFSWDVKFTYTQNKTTIEELVEGTDFITFWRQAKGGAMTWVGEEVGQIVDRKFVRVEDPNSKYFGWPLLDDEGWENDDRTLSEDGKRVAPVIGNYNPDFQMGMLTSLNYKNWNLSMLFDWRKGGQFVSQTHRYYESDLRGDRWLDKVYDLSDVDDIPAYILANADNFLSPSGEFYPLVGGPTAELGGFPYDGLNDGVFLPGVIGEYNADGTFNDAGATENIGGPDTQYHPYGDNYPWSFTKASTFDADYIKLREISLSYNVPKSLTNRWKIQNASIAVFSRNIILWTKAGINIDPESAFQASGGTLSQGVERYNVQPWAIPIGIKLNLSI